jgi:pimeloyl-ACP methyl ester carboxylesterase
VSGPEDAPPLLLIHASGIAGWSWIHNIGELNKHYRTYAVDSIGDVGKSVLNDLTNPLAGGEEIGRFYTDVTNKLGFDQSYLAGASVGGYISTNYALHAPERVKKLVLLGSMGYSNTNTTVMLMVLAQSFPFKWVQDMTFQ